MPYTVSDHIVSILEEWGVDTVFGLPGDGINGLVEALRKSFFGQSIRDRRATRRQVAS